MGALLSQAVANQLRQYPGFQNPNPSPQTLLQQVLNPPGPSLPMWQAPVLENQQLAAINTPEANRAFAQDMMRAALAFGGADITKEQKAAWEAENAAYRATQLKGKYGEPFPPGTRVAMRPWGQRTREPTSIYAPGKLNPPNQGDIAGGTGVIVTPGTPEAGEPAYKTMPEFATRVARGMEPGPVRAGPLRGGVQPVGEQAPGPDYVAVRGEQSGHWFWRHRDSLEILPPRQLYKIFGLTEETGPAMARSEGNEWHLTPEEAQTHWERRFNPHRERRPMLVRAHDPPARFVREGNAWVARPEGPTSAGRGIRQENVKAVAVAPEHIEVQVGKDQWISLNEWIKRGGK